VNITTPRPGQGTTITFDYGEFFCFVHSFGAIWRTSEKADSFGSFMPALVNEFWISATHGEAPSANPDETPMLINGIPVGNRAAVAQQYVSAVWQRYVNAPKATAPKPQRPRSRRPSDDDESGTVEITFGELMQIAADMTEIGRASEQPGAYQPRALGLVERFVISCPEPAHFGDNPVWNSVKLNDRWYGNRSGTTNEYVKLAWAMLRQRQATPIQLDAVTTEAHPLAA
jgi:hypothetical protein